MIQRGCLLIFGDIKESGLPHQKGKGSVYINNWIPGALSNYSRIVKIIEKNRRYIKLREEQALPPLKAGEFNRLGSLSIASTKFRAHKLTFRDFPRDLNIYQKRGLLRKKRNYEKRYPTRKLPSQNFIYPYKQRYRLIRIPTISLSISDNKHWMAECQGIGIPSIQIVDTTSSFDQITYPIISNQRSLSFGSLIIDLFSEIMDNALFYKAKTLKIKKKKLHEVVIKARAYNKKVSTRLLWALRRIRRRRYRKKIKKFESKYYKMYRKYSFRPVTFFKKALQWSRPKVYNSYEKLVDNLNPTRDPKRKKSLRKLEWKRKQYLKYLEESLERKKLKKQLKTVILKDIFKFKGVKKYLHRLNKLIIFWGKKSSKEVKKYENKWGPLKRWGRLETKKHWRAREQIKRLEIRHERYINIKSKIKELYRSYKKSNKKKKNLIQLLKAKYVLIQMRNLIKKLRIRKRSFRDKVRRSSNWKKEKIQKYENYLIDNQFKKENKEMRIIKKNLRILKRKKNLINDIKRITFGYMRGIMEPIKYEYYFYKKFRPY